jgi:hypothetical protein
MSQASTGTLIAAAQTKSAGEAGVVTEIQSRLNGHTHGGTTPVLPVAERATTPFIPG